MSLPPRFISNIEIKVRVGCEGTRLREVSSFGNDRVPRFLNHLNQHHSNKRFIFYEEN